MHERELELPFARIEWYLKHLLPLSLAFVIHVYIPWALLASTSTMRRHCLGSGFYVPGESLGASWPPQEVRGVSIGSWECQMMKNESIWNGTAKEQGQFNLKRWRDMSMSLAETMERIQSGSQALRVCVCSGQPGLPLDVCWRWWICAGT